MSSVFDAIAALGDREAAEALLVRMNTPEAIRAVVLRAEELRFSQSERSVGVAKAAIKALSRISDERQHRSLAVFSWAIYGSTFRSMARFDEAESALSIAARSVSGNDRKARAEVARRLAYLRAEQRRFEDAKALFPVFLEWGKQVGGRAYGEELAGAGAIMIRVNDFASAARLAEESLSYLPAGTDRFYISSLYNLARSRIELSSTEAELISCVGLIDEVARHIEAGTYPDFRLHWLRGKLFSRLGQLEDSFFAFDSARRGIEAQSNGLDRALLMLDLAELHLERGEPEAARQLALSSFPILKLLRTNPDAYRALLTLHRAAQDRALDSAGVAMVRERLGVS